MDWVLIGFGAYIVLALASVDWKGKGRRPPVPARFVPRYGKLRHNCRCRRFSLAVRIESFMTTTDETNSNILVSGTDVKRGAQRGRVRLAESFPNLAPRCFHLTSPSQRYYRSHSRGGFELALASRSCRPRELAPVLATFVLVGRRASACLCH